MAFVAVVVHASPGQVLLVLAAGSRLSAYIGATVGEIGFLRGIWLDGSIRLAWLEDYAAALLEHCRRARARAALDRNSLRARLVRLSGNREACARGCLPGSQAGLGRGDRGRERRRQDHAREAPLPALPADRGSHPRGRARPRADAGRSLAVAARRRVPGFLPVRVPGAPHRGRRRCPPARRRARGAGAAVERAGASDVVARLASGLETQLGPTWPDGVEVSFGQWQKLALARGFMRDRPLLLVLDEPTAALDAETEHALFERYAAAAREREVERRHSEATTAGSRSSSRIASAPCGWPTSSSCSTAPAWSRWEATRSSWPSGKKYAELYGIQAAAYR